ncbi:hypothetical protein [Halapricum desulfuricans]|uniref:hypothetical protein n=1 Tax=Halapricum desulfuricans TaxID=2841257 RepID=UPI001E46820C|nr:hypothetical protein [Halapricum desulfuricans]
MTDPDAPLSPRIERRTLLVLTGTASAAAISGCLSAPSSRGPSYERLEIDGSPPFEPGLQDVTDRGRYAALVVTERQAELFDFRRLSDPEAAFVGETDFSASYLGVVQVCPLNSSMRFEVVDVHESDVTLTVGAVVRDEPPHSDDRVISTLLLRIRRPAPDRITVELDIANRRETFSGARL